MKKINKKISERKEFQNKIKHFQNSIDKLNNTINNKETKLLYNNINNNSKLFFKQIKPNNSNVTIYRRIY